MTDEQTENGLYDQYKALLDQANTICKLHGESDLKGLKSKLNITLTTITQTQDRYNNQEKYKAREKKFFKKVTPTMHSDWLNDSLNEYLTLRKAYEQAELLYRSAKMIYNAFEVLGG